MKVSATQMAKVIGVSRRTVVTWCKRGLLGQDAQMIGGRWVIDWHDFLFDGSPVVLNLTQVDMPCQPSLCE
ncbi:helix-turn-helix domain-containing protein [Nitrosomonas sp.]|uniref:helix-turn-helix domain-containing protein n=1 Tax=Nitrosomonas sp. TaxID=42353 RepID=UPI0025D52017|nr:helix-turn-helix domain-containing protein [Nitrosomonas sp.]MBY0485062.1 helix-turn-helix domain-containing protein [Nitrosomonas sp.]